ncbi:MAG: hypothetical protein IKB20_04455 [Clostridia bacterium]|nr:hypothetical protein [Clostridia bacterium]
MKGVFKDKKNLANCKIYQMLAKNGKRKHLSFHTPGHKVKGWDITELSYSDNLSSPKGCIFEAERDIANILGAKKSFILTDGSTSGVLSMLYAAKLLGANSVAFPLQSHKSVWNGCALLGLVPLAYPEKADGADAILLTSPSYYGRVENLAKVRQYCNERGKLLLIDGAHGGHLHFDKDLYAGTFADMWVDGVHKSLPALTQGAVVSAREGFVDALKKGVDIFRTTSPSYPVMASVEYAVKYPKNLKVEREVRAYADGEPRASVNEDWTKLLCRFGLKAFEAEKYLESKGIFAEFCDGEYICFYLSPATKMRTFKNLKKHLEKAFEKYQFEENPAIKRIPAPLNYKHCGVEQVDLDKAIGRVCAENCGLFPPCTPILCVGDRIDSESVRRLQNANNVYGVYQGKISVFEEN